MKNKMLKIMSVILTVAILSGLLMMAAPVPASAAVLSWSAVTGPKVYANTSANVFTMSNDGKIMYLYANRAFTLPAATNVPAGIAAGAGPTSITVASTAGYPPAGTIVIGAAGATETVNYTGITGGNTFTGLSGWPTIGGLTAQTAGHAAAVAVNFVTSTDMNKLYKSVDGGKTWTASGLDTGTTKINGLAINFIKVHPTSTDNLIAATATALYRSTNGGQTWQLYTPTITGFGASTIYSIDITTSVSGGIAYLVGATNGPFLYDPDNVGGWVRLGGPATTLAVALPAGAIAAPNIVTLVSTAGLASSGTIYIGPDLVTYTGIAGATLTGATGTINAAGALVGDPVSNAANGRSAALAFSPTYANDTVIVNVALNDGVAGGAIVQTIVAANPTTSIFNQDVGNAIISGTATSTYVTPVAVTLASIAFPSDYNWASAASNRVFVGLSALTGGGLGSVYRLNGASPAAGSRVVDLQLGQNVASISYAGTMSSGLLAAGLTNANIVYSTTNANGTSINWSNSTNNPTGFTLAPPAASVAAGNVLVKFLPTSTATAYTLYAGAAGVGSGLAVSTDANSFQEIGMISVSSYGAVNFGGGGSLARAGQKTQWQRMFDNGIGANMYLQSDDTGTTWKEIYNNLTYGYGAFAGPGLVLSPSFDTDKTMYIQQGGTNANRVVKSSDGGLTWIALSTPGNVNITAMSAVDANTYWAGSASGVRLSSAASWVNLDGTSPLAMFVFPGFFIVQTTTGEVYVSTDSGATFTRLGNLNEFGTGAARMTFDVAAKTIYAVDDASGDIVKWAVGTDASWTVVLSDGNFPTDLRTYDNKQAISLSGGIFYIKRSTSTTIEQIWRSVNALSPNAGTNYDFEPVPGTIGNAYTGFGALVGPGPFITVTQDANKNSVLYTSVSGPVVASTNSYPVTYKSFTDVVLAAPATTAPAANATTSATVDFSWKAVSYTGAKYTVQVSYDNTFNSNVLASVYPTSPATYTDITSTILAAVPLSPGRTYYWRVKVSDPVSGQWSAPIQFSTQVTSIGSANTPGINSPGTVAPVSGATGVGLTPLMTWGPVQDATGYDIKIATDAAFTQVVDSKNNVQGTVYTPAAALKANTTYFWEVRALNGTAAGNWVTFAFTTGTGAAPAPTGPAATQPPLTIPPITVPTPVVTVNVAPATGTTQPPATPGYIWVIIAIGAVLVIAVIVLIARTRRV